MKKSVKRITSAILATMILASTSVVFAGGDTLPPREGEQGYKGVNQPGYHGYSKQAILNWSPQTDPFSEFMRASVPLQERNEEFRATQANPKLDPKVQVLSLTGDYGNQFFNAPIYNDQFSQNLFNFWQYEDIYASWHGTVVDPTPESLFDAEAPWYERKYEFGIINIPNPAYTNAAHKNGVKAIGCVFFPRTEHPKDWIYKDENGRFPLADKLVEMAKYYGFDGYFVNAEEKVPADFMPTYSEFMKAMVDQGLYVQVYASNPYGQFNKDKWGGIDYYKKDATEFSNWIKKPEDSSLSANSLYMNPGPSKEHVNGSVKIMESLGLDPKETVFNTLEAGQTGFSGVRGSLNNTLDENLVPRTGIASLGTSTCWEHLDETVFGHTGDNSYKENRRSDPDYQKYIFARERTWWTGSQNQPYYSNSDDYIVDGVSFLNKNTTKYTREETNQLLQAIIDAETNPYKTANDPTRADYDGTSSVHDEFQSWPGMAAFAAEKSVIDGTNFYTNFNTGHGMQYFVDGKISNDNEWANINIQDILPTWQWWIDAENKKSPLKVDFDYGTKYNPAFALNQIGGYNGGSSLVVKGDLASQNTLRLYKTDMDINANSKLDITFFKSSNTDKSTMKLALIFKDAPKKIEYVNVEDSSTKSSNWTTKSIALSQFAGRELASFGLAFDPVENEVKDYQMNIGEIKIYDNSVAKPQTPTGLKIDKAFNTGEVYISWDIEDYNKVKQYNVYAEYEDGSQVFLGGIYDDIYYIKSLYKDNENVKIKLTAVAEDGTESEPAIVERNLKTDIEKITLTSKTGYVDATWTNPTVKHNAIKAELTLNNNDKAKTITQMLSANETNTSIDVPYVDGEKYTLRLSYLDEQGNTVSYTDTTGTLSDIYSAHYEGTATMEKGGIRLTPPTSKDWWHAYVKQNGKYISAKDDVNYLYRGQDLKGLKVEGDKGFVEVILEDFNSNMSKPVYVTYGEEKVEINKDLFPDEALLKAVLSQAKSIEDLSNITEIDLSNTNIENLKGLSLLHNLEKINLSNCSDLKIVKDIPTSVKTIDITGATKLEAIYAPNSSIEKIIYKDTKSFEKLISFDVQNNKLDLTEKTPERILADLVKKNSQGKQDIVVSETETYKAGAIYTGQKPLAYVNKMQDTQIEKSEGKASLNDLFGKFVTINGTDFMSLEGADFIAPEFKVSEECKLQFNQAIRATQTNKDTNFITHTNINKNLDATYNVELLEYKLDKAGELKATQTTTQINDNATLIVGDGGNKEDIIKINIKLDKNNATLNVGKTLKLNATITPENMTNKLVWASSNQNIATVKDGVITAIAKGTTTITAKIDNIKAECKVTVIENSDNNNNNSNVNTNKNPETSKNPQTSDNVSLLSMLLISISAIFVFGLIFTKKIRNK